MQIKHSVKEQGPARSRPLENSDCNPTESVVKYNEDAVRSLLRYVQANLDNYTGIGTCDETQDALKGESEVAQNRVRVMTGSDAFGAPVYTWVGGKTQDERNDNIVREYYASGRLWQVIGIDPIGLTGRADRSDIVLSDKEKHLFCDYAWGFFRRYKEPKLAENSKVRETASMNVLCKAFAGKNIEDITADDVQDFINQRASGGTSAVTIKDNVACLRQILNAAVEDKLRSDNPAKSTKVTVGGRETEGTKALSVGSMKAIISHIPYIQDKRTQLFLALLCCTGMRREEVLGLQWNDIDYANKRIHVQRAVTYPKGVRIVKGTKSKAGNRFIPIPDKLILLLKAYPKADTEYKDYVLLNERGEMFSDRGVDRLLANVREELGMNDITAKTFRTTFATMMVASNSVSVKELQVIMGHSNIKTTLDIYTKVEQTIISTKRNVLMDFLESVSDQGVTSGA